MDKSRQKLGRRGFTIIELMIATMVFGTVLLGVTTAILQFTRVYYTGITAAKLQDTTRTIVDQISQGIQFNGGNVTNSPASPTAGSSYAFCVGNMQYSFTLGYELEDTPTSSQTYHALVANNVPGCTSSTPAQNMRVAAVSGREMLAPNMRLSNLQVTSIGTNVYRISIRIVYGDDNVLKNPNTTTAACTSGAAMGNHFCAVSDLTTVVTKRVQ